MKLSKPKISIVIPVYNVEKYLRRCLDSVLNQTFSDWQAICIDDGSPDKSGKILDEYAKKDKRFIVVHKKNGGVSSARNDAVKKIETEYTMFLDSDDCIHPQTMEIIYTLAQKTKVDIVSFKYDIDLYKKVSDGADIDENVSQKCLIKYDVNKIPYKRTDKLIKYSTERNHSFGKYKVRHCYPVVHLYKTDLIKDIKFDGKIKISEDFPFWTSVLLKNPRSLITRLPLYFYIPHKTSALRGADNIKVFDNVILATKKSFDNVMKNNRDNKWLKLWSREFLWPFIITIVKSARGIQNAKHVADGLLELKETGMIDNPQTMRARKYKRRIEKFISENS